MKKLMYAVVFLFEGYDDNLPYSSVLGVYDDRESAMRELERNVEMDCQEVDRDDEYFESKNFVIKHKYSDGETLLQHSTYVDCFTKYSIQLVDVFTK
jgi:hypothetical protein